MATEPEDMPYDEYKKLIDKRFDKLYKKFETDRRNNNTGKYKMRSLPGTSTVSSSSSSSRNDSKTNSPRSKVLKDDAEITGENDTQSKYNSTNKVAEPESTCTSSNIERDLRRETTTLSLSPSRSIQSKKPRMFTKWKVILNEKYQLRIVGNEERGELALSRPIVKRLTSTTVESASKHLYALQGNIVDDEQELPEYIHHKFYTGFPDDWENVRKVWRTFVRGGSKATFRWPVESTDHLGTVVDSTHVLRDNPEAGTLESASFKKPHRENCNPQDNMLLNSSWAKKTRDELKNKLDAFVDDLNNENCSPEYKEAVAGMFSCMKYFASCIPKKGEVCIKDSEVEQSKCMVQGRNNETGCTVKSNCERQAEKVTNVADEATDNLKRSNNNRNFVRRRNRKPIMLMSSSSDPSDIEEIPVN